MASRGPTQGEQLVGMRKDIDRLVEIVSEAKAMIERNESARQDEIKAIRAEVTALSKRQGATETRVDKVLGNVRAFGAGMAAAFTLLGGGIATAVGQLLGWFK